MVASGGVAVQEHQVLTLQTDGCSRLLYPSDKLVWYVSVWNKSIDFCICLQPSYQTAAFQLQGWRLTNLLLKSGPCLLWFLSLPPCSMHLSPYVSTFYHPMLWSRPGGQNTALCCLACILLCRQRCLNVWHTASPSVAFAGLAEPAQMSSEPTKRKRRATTVCVLKQLASEQGPGMHA